MTRIALALPLALSAGACAAPQAAPGDPAQRARLLDAVKALEGTWEMSRPGGEPQRIEFKVSSGGSVVREIMFPGTPEEMTNIYRLEGDFLAVTHYCVQGNQPEMRASAQIGKQLEFGLVHVADLKAAGELYMGGLTLEFVDHDHLVEHWRSFVQGELQKDHSPDFALTRRK